MSSAGGTKFPIVWLFVYVVVNVDAEANLLGGYSYWSYVWTENSF